METCMTDMLTFVRAYGDGEKRKITPRTETATSREQSDSSLCHVQLTTAAQYRKDTRQHFLCLC
jgi:hypothetical protein